MTELYQQEQGNLATGGSSATQHTRAAAEAAYQKKAESLLSDENCYKVVIVSRRLLTTEPPFVPINVPVRSPRHGLIRVIKDTVKSYLCMGDDPG